MSLRSNAKPNFFACLRICNKVKYLNLGLRETRRSYPRYDWVDLSKFPVNPKWWFLKGGEIRLDCCNLLICPVHIFSHFFCAWNLYFSYYYTNSDAVQKVWTTSECLISLIILKCPKLHSGSWLISTQIKTRLQTRYFRRALFPWLCIQYELLGRRLVWWLSLICFL